MTRRELYQFVGTLRTAAEKNVAGNRADEAVLNAVESQMFRQRGRNAGAENGDPGLLPLLHADGVRRLLDGEDALGQIYQALNAPALEAAYRATSKDKRKFSADEIPTVSQLFTPRWVVEFLLHNTLGRLWIEWHPDSRLPDRLTWLAARKEFGRLPPLRLLRGRAGAGAECAREKSPDPNPPPEYQVRGQKGYTGSTDSIRLAADIRVLDPSCGTMNFGLVALELLQWMYEEELDRAGQPGWAAETSVRDLREIPEAVLRNNLFGIDIDPVALRLARASLRLKSGVDLPDNQWNLWRADSLFDDSIAAKWNAGFDVVVTNPPYVSSRNLAASHVTRMKKRFPAAWRDLYACFIERSLDFAREGGRVGLLTMQSFMFTGAYQRLRANIGQRSAMEILAHFGPGLFAIGNPGTLQTVAFVAKKEADANRRAEHWVSAFRLTDVPREEKEDALRRAVSESSPVALGDLAPYPGTPGEGWGEGLTRRPIENPHPNPLPAYREREPEARTFRLPQSALSDLPRQSWAYWIDAPLRRAFKIYPRLGDVAPPRQGLATTDNFRFVRYWWEVEPTNRDAAAKATDTKWMPYAKSGQFRRWYESPRHRVNWQDDGREIKQAIVDRYPYLNGQWKWVAKNASYYGRGGITWSYLTSGRFSARRLEPGSIFDVAGSSLFPDDVPGMLAVLNSSAIHRLLEAVNPTVNFQVGDLAELPVPEKIPAELAAFAESAIRLQQEFDAGDETAPDFTAPPPWKEAADRAHSLSRKLLQIENSIDTAVCEIYGVGTEIPETKSDPQFDIVECARRWVSFAVGKLLGRFFGSSSGRILQIDPPDARVIADVGSILDEHAGASATPRIDKLLGGIGPFLAGEFFAWHVRLYRWRPPYWALRSGARMYLVAHDAVTRESLQPVLRDSNVTLGQEWKRRVDDGIALGLLPFRSMLPDLPFRRKLDEIAAEAAPGRFSWADPSLAGILPEIS